MSEERSLVLCMRVADMPAPWVPSERVSCDSCGAPCWLSRLSGGDSLRLAAEAGEGDPGITCLPCLIASGAEHEMRIAPSALREAAGLE